MNNLLFTIQAWIAARYGDDSERGATMVEYGLLVALIAVAVIVAATALGTGVSDMFDTVVAAFP